MATVRELKTKWQLRFYDAKRSPGETTVSLPKTLFSRRRDAEKEANRLQALYDYSGDFDPWTQDYPGQKTTEREAVSLSDLAERYITEKEEAGKRGQRGGWTPATKHGKASNVRAFTRMAGEDKLPSDLTEKDVRAYVFRDKLAHETKRTYYEIARAFLNWIEENDYGSAPPLPAPVQQRRRFPQYVTEKELEAICAQHLKTARKAQEEKPKGLRHQSSAWYCDLYRFRFYQGHRPAEAMAQRVGAIDLERNLMAVGDRDYVPKTKREDVIPVVPPARELVAKLCEGKKPGERLFGRKSYRKPSRAFKKAAQKVVPYKVEQGLKFYNLRHSCGVYWRRQGVPLGTIEELLRHSDSESTKIYAAIEPTDAGRHFEEAYGG